jgi:hypothetical protein
MWVTQGTPSTLAAMASKIGFITSQVLARAAGHDGRPLARAFLAAGHAGSDEAQAQVAQPLVAALGVGVERVAAVDDDVTLVEQRDELFDHGVDRAAGLDHDHDLARAGQDCDEFLEGLVPTSFLSGWACDELHR